MISPPNRLASAASKPKHRLIVKGLIHSYVAYSKFDERLRCLASIITGQVVRDPIFNFQELAAVSEVNDVSVLHDILFSLEP